jgi:hypothetical protein
LGNGVIVGIQSTTTGNLPDRRNKIFALHQTEDTIHRWITFGGSIELHGWAKRGDRGKRKTWTLKRQLSVYNSTTRELKFVEVEDNAK